MNIRILCLTILLSGFAGFAGKNDLPHGINGEEPKLKGQAIKYIPGDNYTRGYLATPKKKKKSRGAVVLIHEWDGLNNRVRSVADALAKEGYIALCVDYYKGHIGQTQADNRKLIQKAQEDPKALIDNLNHAIRHLRERGDVGKIAIIGWGFGGKLALDMAIKGDAHDTTGIFYGRLDQKPEDLKKISHSIFGIFGGRDRAITPKKVEAFDQALNKAGIAHEFHSYPKVNHGFFLWVDRDYEYNADPAKEAWGHLLAYLKKTIRK